MKKPKPPTLKERIAALEARPTDPEIAARVALLEQKVAELEATSVVTPEMVEAGGAHFWGCETCCEGDRADAIRATYEAMRRAELEARQ